MDWNLYENDKFLEPLKFSNGKTQEDVVKEVLDSIKQGNKIIFIQGVCGTGKSAIALNIARKLGKTSIVVPGKTLQAQYKKDYEKNKYLLKDNKKKLKISVITGRNNHKCKFLEDNKNAIPKFKKEVNSKLHDIFSGKKKEIIETIGQDISADNYNIPCKIEIKERNSGKIRAYLRQNKKVNIKDFSETKDVKRMSIAPVCPYWSPVVNEKYELKNLDFVKKRKYSGLNNTNFVFYSRKPGCSFYEQFNEYIDADVIIFNSLKYKLESAMNRKPLTEVEIIDECDEFLDSFSNQRNININRLQNTLIRTIVQNAEAQKIILELIEITKQIKRNKRINDAVFNQEILSLKETGIYDLLKILLDNKEFVSEIDNESYFFEVLETARMFDEFFNETYLSINKKDESLVVSLVTTNLAKKFKEMVDKNKILVLMSGTLHSKEVLTSVFGLDNFEMIEAETEQQGEIEIKRTYLEMDCKYSNFSSGKFTRENYLQALDKCVEVAEKPLLIHINAFKDLPSEEEIKNFKLNNLMSDEKIREIQKQDKIGEEINKFKRKEMSVLFSTKCARGVDFPGEECKSIVFTKYPNPNVKNAFWKILNKTKPQQYWSFYRDKAKRELLQKVYRGLRFKQDHIFLLSPDSRVLDAFEKKF